MGPRLRGDDSGKIEHKTSTCSSALPRGTMAQPGGLEACMRFRFLTIVIPAALVAGAVVACGWTFGVAAPTSGSLLADKSSTAVPVDTELVLAVDVSYSMDPEEQKLQ